MSEEGSVPGEIIESPRPGTPGIHVDRNHAVRVAGDAAREMKDGLGDATRTGLRIARDARPGDVFELTPPADLAKGLKDHTLRVASPTRGDASVLIKDVKTGKFVGKADLVKPKTAPMKVLGPAAFGVMALATQQHYLVEISTKLEGIKKSVDEIKALHQDDRIGALNHLREFAARIRNAADRDGMVAPHQLDQLRDAAVHAEEIWHQVLETTRRHLEQYEAGETEASEVQVSFCVLAYAVKALTECSEALMGLPYATAAEFNAVLTEERDRLYPMLPEFHAVCHDLLEASKKWSTEELEYNERRPKNPVARTQRLPPMDVHTEDGFTFHIHAKPKVKPLGETDMTRLRRLVSGPDDAPRPLVVEVDTDGTVLLGPAQVGEPSIES